jgi:hypothetical protein
MIYSLSRSLQNAPGRRAVIEVRLRDASTVFTALIRLQL